MERKFKVGDRVRINSPMAQGKVDNKPEDSTHPYTVILKSGVKVGISATIFDYINEQNSDTKSVQTVADGTIVLSEIAAIVPTENIQ